MEEIIDKTEVITRFDRHLALNIHDFVSFKQYSNLIKDICVYIAFKYNNTKDLFENGKFDPYDFAKNFGYSRENLFRTITVKETLDGILPHTVVNGKKYMLDTVLEYSLFLMGKINLQMSFGKKESGSDDVNMSYRFIQLLKGFDVTINDKFGEKKGKRVYYFQPAPDFINNLARCFVDVNISLIPMLRKSNLFDLYFYLISMQNILAYKNKQGHVERGEPTFDFLCELADVNYKEVKQSKKNLTKKILKVIQDAQLFLRFEWEGLGKYKYSPVFSLTQMPVALVQNSNYNRFDTVFIRKCEDWFLDNLPVSQCTFQDWFTDHSTDLDRKIRLFIEAYKVIYSQVITPDHKDIRRYFKI